MSGSRPSSARQSAAASIVAATGDIREACRRLIQRANERGGEDNITAVLIKIEEVEDKKDEAPSSSGESRSMTRTDPAPAGHTPNAANKTGT